MAKFYPGEEVKFLAAEKAKKEAIAAGKAAEKAEKQSWFEKK